jgi:small subunit ribosomal protein S20
MPRTASAARRVRVNARRAARNHSVKARLKTLEKRYRHVLAEKQRDAAAAALRQVVSALDKAAKAGVIHRGKADRKKSRLTSLLAKLTPAAPAQPAAATSGAA